MRCLYTEEQYNGVASFLKHTNQLINTIKVEVITEIYKITFKYEIQSILINACHTVNPF